MKLRYVAFCFMAIALSACQPPGASKNGGLGGAKDTLVYNYQVFKQREADCGNKPDSGCTVITFKYPVFKGQTKLNDTVTRRLLSIFSESDKPDTGFNQLAKTFLANYQSDKKDANYPEFYTIDAYSKVLKQDSGLVTLETGGYTFTGGAHGASYTYFINWDVKAGKNLVLNDLFIAGYEDKLKNIGEKIFRKDEKLSDTASLANGYFFKDNKFVLNDNFLITPSGLRFLYNNYEIKSYAQGTTDLFIPWSQIKSLLRPNTVVTQYIK